jgi:hypothetical protein
VHAAVGTPVMLLDSAFQIDRQAHRRSHVRRRDAYPLARASNVEITGVEQVAEAVRGGRHASVGGASRARAQALDRALKHAKFASLLKRIRMGAGKLQIIAVEREQYAAESFNPAARGS